MIWLTWRQHRIEAVVAILLLVVLCIIFIRDGITEYAALQNPNIAACLAQLPSCDMNIQYDFYTTDLLTVTTSRLLLPWLFLIVGVFVGAPLIAREREQRTHYLVWTQSVTRGRWLAVKLGLLAAAVLLTFTTLTLVTTWWSQPANELSSPWYQFSIQGFVLPAYALFGLIVGVALGVFIPKTVPAMALTFLIVLVFSITMHLAMIHYIVPPISRFLPASGEIDGRWGQQGDDVFYAGFADTQGRETGELSDYCGFHKPSSDPTYGSLANTCIRALHLQWKVVYQPASHFWLVQSVEAGIVLAISIGLVLLIFWRLRKRLN